MNGSASTVACRRRCRRSVDHGLLLLEIVLQPHLAPVDRPGALEIGADRGAPWRWRRCRSCRPCAERVWPSSGCAGRVERRAARVRHDDDVARRIARASPSRDRPRRGSSRSVSGLTATTILVLSHGAPIAGHQRVVDEALARIVELQDARQRRAPGREAHVLHGETRSRSAGCRAPPRGTAAAAAGGRCPGRSGGCGRSAGRPRMVTAVISTSGSFADRGR